MAALGRPAAVALAPVFHLGSRIGLVAMARAWAVFAGRDVHTFIDGGCQVQEGVGSASCSVREGGRGDNRRVWGLGVASRAVSSSYAVPSCGRGVASWPTRTRYIRGP